MGIRSTQIFGLTEKAEQLLAFPEQSLYFEHGHQQYPDGRVEDFTREVKGNPVVKRQSGTYTGMFEEHYPLWEYQLPDGRVLCEQVQETVWSSGPCIFLALQEDDHWVVESLWPRQEIDQA